MFRVPENSPYQSPPIPLWTYFTCTTTWIHHYQPKTLVVYTRVPWWWCRFTMGYCRITGIAGPNHPLCSFSPPFHQPLATTDLSFWQHQRVGSVPDRDQTCASCIQAQSHPTTRLSGSPSHRSFYCLPQLCLSQYSNNQNLQYVFSYFSVSAFRLSSFT